MTTPQRWTKVLLFVCWCRCLCLCSYLLSWPGWGWYLTVRMGNELSGLILLVLKGFSQRSGSGLCTHHHCTQRPLLFLGCLEFVPLSQIAATAFPQPRRLCKTKPGMVKTSPFSYCRAVMDEITFYLPLGLPADSWSPWSCSACGSTEPAAPTAPPSAKIH